MPIFPRLAQSFRRHGFDLVAGLNPGHFKGAPRTACTFFLKDGKSYTEGLGISVQEIYFLECLTAALKPRNLFVIGNSTGWSVLALGMMADVGRVIGMDAGFDAHSIDGLAFTNVVAAEEGIDVKALQGVSPQDVERVAREGGLGPLDFAFIDGWHTNEQLIADFKACRAVAAKDCVFVFHDVVSCSLESGFEAVIRESGLSGRVLMGTSSGIGLLFDPALRPEIMAVADAFAATPAALETARREAFAHRHRHLARWRRSAEKRCSFLRRVLGGGN